MNNKNLLLLIITSLAVIVGLAIFSFYTNQVGTTAIQTRLGSIAYVRNNPGFYFKMGLA